MSTIAIQFDDFLVKSVTFRSYGKKDRTSRPFSFTTPLEFIDAEPNGNWSGKIYWDSKSDHTDPTLIGTVTNGEFSLNSSWTVKVKDRTIYIYGKEDGSGGGGGTTTPTYETNAIYFRTGEGIDKYTMEYSNSTESGQTVDVTSPDRSITAFVRKGTNAKLKSFTPSNGYSSTYYFVEYTDSSFKTRKKTFDDKDGYVLSNGIRYIKLFARARKQLLAGTFPSMLESIEVTDGTFTLSSNSIYYSTQQKIKSVGLTQNAIARQWTGNIYWGDDEGSTSYLIATVTNGIVKLESSIQSINYTGENRTIYFTAIGSYAATFKFKLSDTNEGLVSFQVNRYASQGGSLLESKTISSNINFTEILAPSSNYIEITQTIIVVIKDGTKEINRNGFTAPLITAIADSSSYQDQSDYLTVQIPGSVTQSPVYNSYGFRAGLRPNHHTFLVGSFAKNYTYKIYANKGYWTTGTDPKSKSIKSTEQVDFSNYSTLVKRFGCDLDGWGLSATGGKVTVPNGKYWITDNTDFYAVWTKNIGLFYWDGNTGATDDSIIAKGLPITNLTAERWNRLREKVLAVANARANVIAINKINATSTVQPTNTLTASMFNAIREAIAALEGSTTLPDEVNSNEPVLASYFNGSTSLKSALNAAIIAWNNS